MVMELSEASRTLSPLPSVLSKGLVAVSVCGLLSFFASTILFLYLTWRLVTWRWQSGFSQPTNQFLILIYNLLFADIQQAIAFSLNLDSLRHNSIRVGTTTCWAQGWFISTGDLASSIMISAIGIHTFLAVVKGYRLSPMAFWSAITGCWVFVYLLGALGPIMHGEDFYVRAGAWCWVNEKYSAERLWLHYFWMFVCIFTCIITYSFIIIYIRTAKSRPDVNLSPEAIAGVTPLMILYPLIYTVCTTPVAVARLYALRGGHVGLTFFCAAGAMIASNGWLDVLLYATTRREIVFSDYPPGEDTGLETFAFMGKGHRLGTVTTIQAAGNSKSKHERNISGRLIRSSESVENLYGLGDITVKGEVTVKIEQGPHDLTRKDRLVSDDSIGESRSEERGWDSRSAKSGKSILMTRL